MKNTYYIAMNMIDIFMPDNTIRLPDFVIPNAYKGRENDLLREKCFLGLKNKKLDENEIYVNRLEYELNVVWRNGFAKYFLTMDKINEMAVNMCLTGGGRGRAAGALLSYCLGITQVDPIRFELLFERFMTAPKPSGFYDPNGKSFGGIKTKIDKLFKVVMDDGKEY